MHDNMHRLPIIESIMQTSNIITIETDSEQEELLKWNLVMWNIWKIDSVYYMIYENEDVILVSDITRQMEMQFNLTTKTIYTMLVLSLLTYLISIIFVKHSLKNLNKLVTYSKNINLNTLHKKIDIKWPKDDEIKIVADSLNQALSRIHNQTESLKSFISSASHELKTPLMKISSEIDFGIKSQTSKESLRNIKKDIMWIDKMIELLLLITNIENQKEFETKKENISEITNTVIENISTKYKAKNIELKTNIQEWINQKINKSGFEMIIKNLVENAFKYTNESWKIDISLNQDKLTIKDNWIWISKKDQEKIRERFWTKSESRTDENSFGLWLHLVNLLVCKHWWKIKLESELDKGSEFEILF